MRRTVESVLLASLRGASLGLFAVGVGAFCLYRFWPAPVQRLDAALFAAAADAADGQVLAALEPGVDPATALAQLEAARARRTGFHHGDRKERAWFGASLLLLQAARGAGDLARARTLVDELAAAHPRDVLVRLQQVDVLRSGGDDDAADAALSALFAQVPEYPAVAARATARALALGDPAAAGRALAHHLRLPPALLLRVFYREAAASQLDQALDYQRAILRPRRTAGGAVAARFRAPAGATALELHLPPGVPCALRSVRLTVGDWGSDAPTSVVGLTPAAIGWQPLPDPVRAAIFDLPAPLPTATDADVAVALSLPPAAELQPILAGPGGAAVVTALLAGGDADAALVDRERRLSALAAAPPAVATGPGGATSTARTFDLDCGWPGASGRRVAWTATFAGDHAIDAVDVPWPAALVPAGGQPPRVDFEPAPTTPPTVEVHGDRLQLRLAAPQTVLRVTLEGTL